MRRRTEQTDAGGAVHSSQDRAQDVSILPVTE
jgi:hypothetical protein